MKKNKFNNSAGLTLIEIVIGVVISTIMMAAMYTTYSVVNNSYSQVTDRAKISRSGRDMVGMLMRDIRMAGFKYFFGTNSLGIASQDNLQYVGGNSSIDDSHDPIIVIKNKLGYGTGDTLDGSGLTTEKNAEDDLCCDRIHIVYGDFNQNDVAQPYKRYRVTYYAQPRSNGDDRYYGVYKTKESWIQTSLDSTGSWRDDCTECYRGELIRDHLVDMEFIVFDKQGRIINPPPRPDNSSRKDLYNIRVVDVRLTFRSKKEFFRFSATDDKPRLVKGLGERFGGVVAKEFTDKFLRDSIVVSVHTRNIGDGV